ncbi:MAG TPA: ribonuclease [Allosphingosinicella sp.]|uniref:ribonuclease n=1 Tax=Allosphingosinicella sp. TaxID=2823234 RepID=UPI002ED8ACC7
MAEWLYEEGIGENRAIRIESGEIAEAIIELPNGPRAGAVRRGRLTSILVPGRRGIVTMDGGAEALLEPLPKLTEGAELRVEVVREAIPEQGRAKLPKVRVTEAEERVGPTLKERIQGQAAPVAGPDLFEQAGWSELLDQAATGEIPFDGGGLRMNLTPAMTLFDVDGALPAAALAVAGAEAAGRAIRRFGIGGSIGIDLPTMPAKEDRLKAAAALDAVLPQPFERTAVNGFGFLQVVRRRERPFLPEIVQGDPVGAAARALLRRAEKSRGAGERTIEAAPAVIARLEQNDEWLRELERRIGAAVRLQAREGLAISAGHVHSQFNP